MTTQPSRRLRLDIVDLCAAAAAAAALALAFHIWRYGPAGLIPLHLDFRGRVDGWGDRNEAALVLGAMTVVLGLGYALLAAMGHSQAPDSPARRGLRLARMAVLVVGALVVGLIAEMVFGGAAPGADPAGPARLRVGTLSLIFAVVGALIGKAGPNPIVGVRTYWALKSRLAWDKSNRLAGRLFFWIGLAGLIAAPAAPPELATTILIVAILSAAAVSVFESWRVWRADPERRFP